MSRLVKLERMLERGLDRLRHPETGHALVETIPQVLDEIEDQVVPTGGRGRAFPYPRVVIGFRVTAEEREAARALLRDLPDRVRDRLRARGCTAVDDLAIELRFVTRAGEDWGDRQFRIQYRRATDAQRSRVAAPPPEPVALHLQIVRGRTGVREHRLALARINLGRLEKVASTSGTRARKNHVWFAASEDTVSRAHAHIERVGDDYLLFDEGSASGTRVLRASEEIELMPRASRGVRLRDGDQIELGKACAIDVKMEEPDRAQSS